MDQPKKKPCPKTNFPGCNNYCTTKKKSFENHIELLETTVCIKELDNSEHSATFFLEELTVIYRKNHLNIKCESIVLAECNSNLQD